MTKAMKRIGSLAIACLLTVLLLCAWTAAAEELLEAMTDIALRTGRTIEGTLRIEAEGLLASLGAAPEDAAVFTIASDLLSNGLLRVRYTQIGEQSVIGAALELRGETVLSLDVRTLDGEVALQTSLLPGKTLVAPAELIAQSFAAQVPSALDDALLEALAGAAERYGAVIGDWAMQNEGIADVLEEPLPETQTRNAAARSVTLRVTDAQWQELLRGLAEEFAKDDALQQALASQIGYAVVEPAFLAAMAQQWAGSLGAPQGNAAEVAVFFGEEGQIVGIDVRIEPSASSPADAPGPLQGSFAYGHRSIDAGHGADSYTGSFAWGEGSELQAQFYRRDRVPSPLLPALGEEYGGRALLRTPDAGALELEVLGNVRRTMEPMAETYDHTFDIRLSLQAESADGDALFQMLQAPLLDAGFALSSQTEAVGAEDFRSQGSFALRLMGLEAAIHYTLESSAYVPAGPPENTVVRLDALTPEERDALTRELEENAQGMLMRLSSMSE
ncbi:MAG: hypothetical protein FWE77_02175 [Clostridia bacterium]|nr:hypothetical protein [Clostridia bacterium]